MNTKLVAKWIGLVLLLIVCFCAGLSASALHRFANSLNTPRIESETNARNRIMANIPLPEDATRLYYAHRGFVDADHYIAFSLPSPEACEDFITKELDLKLEDFKKTPELPEFFSEFGPNTWPSEYYDPLWDLSQTDNFLLCTTDRLIVYVPQKNRFYYHY